MGKPTLVNFSPCSLRGTKSHKDWPEFGQLILGMAEKDAVIVRFCHLSGLHNIVMSLKGSALQFFQGWVVRLSSGGLVQVHLGWGD